MLQWSFWNDCHLNLRKSKGLKLISFKISRLCWHKPPRHSEGVEHPCSWESCRLHNQQDWNVYLLNWKTKHESLPRCSKKWSQNHLRRRLQSENRTKLSKKHKFVNNNLSSSIEFFGLSSKDLFWMETRTDFGTTGTDALTNINQYVISNMYATLGVQRFRYLLKWMVIIHDTS